MTILVVPSWYKTDSNPILGSFFYEQAIALAKQGVKVIVADATLQGRQDYLSKRCFRLKVKDDGGILTYSYVVPAMGMMRKSNRGERVFYNNLTKIYRKIVADGHKIDLIHAHSYFPAGIAAVKLGKSEGIPTIVTEHTSKVLLKKISEEQIQSLKYVVEESQKFICVGNALKDAVKELTQTRKDILVVPNMVNRQFNSDDHTKDEEFAFISVGNLIESKRFDLTIRAFSAAFKDKTDVKLKVVGSGVLRTQLELLAEECGVGKQIIFTGRLQRTEVVNEMKKSHVFVLPSDFETFGVVYIEAMACGIPVIGTRNGGAEDIINEKNGLLIDKDDVQQLATAMLQMYSNYTDYETDVIGDYCDKHFGENVICETLISLYNSMI